MRSGVRIHSAPIDSLDLELFSIVWVMTLMISNVKWGVSMQGQTLCFVTFTIVPLLSKFVFLMHIAQECIALIYGVHILRNVLMMYEFHTTTLSESCWVSNTDWVFPRLLLAIPL